MKDYLRECQSTHLKYLSLMKSQMPVYDEPRRLQTRVGTGTDPSRRIGDVPDPEHIRSGSDDNGNSNCTVNEFNLISSSECH
jgi:hypothetical protein